ncbi:hypothetical protein IFM89_010718 [Coptis chinensis]|uniref:Bifunctional dihydrofolate reductase-thymidylate synthase n=1 Tax=Coptis chinensis TaxID=261450 RepID=A0A835IR05_9MAGN|nr:hypothetical protein IFM89_010718 [Coptis chinensis]
MLKFGLLCSRTISFSKVFSPTGITSSNIFYLQRFAANKCSQRFSVMSGGSNVVKGDSHMGPRTWRTYQVIVAATPSMGIGKDGKLPWRLPSDLNFFKEVTMTTSELGKTNAVIMGRKTWESIPQKYRPLPGRLNVVLTRFGSSNIASAENVVVCGGLASALEILAGPPYCLSIEKVFVIGGGQIFSEALNAPECEAIHITEIETNIECDTFMPSIDSKHFRLWYSSFPLVQDNIRHSFATYIRLRSSAAESISLENGLTFDNSSESSKFEIENFSFLPKLIFERHEEYTYLKLVQDIILNGTQKADRTETGTLSKFGCQMRFNLRKYFPLLTTKRVFWRGVVEELLWFISGSTNSKNSLNIIINRFYKKKEFTFGMAIRPENTLTGNIGLVDREEGDLGPVYGFQWRHFGASYTNMHANYNGQGFDQLLDVVNKIRNTPDDRRIVLSAWNPSDLKLMALPPCHMFAQFYVANGELSCQMYQRSADMGLGVPFNIASYSLLTCMIAHVCDLVPGDFVHVVGDAHVYKNHTRPLSEQLQKHPKPFPMLKINRLKKDIDSFVISDFELMGYNPHQKIEMKMAV